MLHRKFRQTDCLKETFALANHNGKVYEYSIENNPDESDDWILSINGEFVNSSQALGELSEYANGYDDALSLYDNKEIIKDSHLLFVRTMWITENENGFYIFKNIENKNYELRSFKKNVAGIYPLNNSFDTLEGAIKYIETIKPKK